MISLSQHPCDEPIGGYARIQAVQKGVVAPGFEDCSTGSTGVRGVDFIVSDSGRDKLIQEGTTLGLRSLY